MKENRKTGALGLTLLTVVSMVDGIIMIPSLAAGVGSISIYAWLTTMAGVMILAYAFSKCGMYTRKSGGMGGYAEYVFGKSGSFIANYAYAVSLLIANVGIAISVTAYSSELFGLTLTAGESAAAAAIILIFTAVFNFWGAGITVKLGTAAMLLTLVPVCVMSVLGIWFYQPDVFLAAWNPHHLGFMEVITQSSSFTLWAFLGLESACSNMDVVRNPEKNVPVAVIASTIVIGLFSILYTTVIQGIIPNDVLKGANAPFGLAMSYMISPLAGDITMASLIAGCAGALLAWQFTLGQLLRLGGEEGYFPSVFKKVNTRGVPMKGMTVMVVMQLFLVAMTASPSLVEQFDALLQLATFTNLVPYILSMAALDMMQRCQGVNSTRNKVSALIGGLYSMYASYACGAEAIVYGTMALLGGYLLYGFILGESKTAPGLSSKQDI